MKIRLDQALVNKSLVHSRSQAESYIKLGTVKVDGNIVIKPGFMIEPDTDIQLTVTEQYVSRAALKLASIAETLKLDFQNKVVLDVGSSTGGFTDYALRHGAKKVVAVEVGTNQLHPSLRNDKRIHLLEQTDIRDVYFRAVNKKTDAQKLIIDDMPDITVIDVSFISLRDILPHLADVLSPKTQIVAMVKPQFEAGQNSLKHKGVIKNDKMRRDILKGFEAWTHSHFVILDKADSAVSGAKGNQERFYLLRKTR